MKKKYGCILSFIIGALSLNLLYKRILSSILDDNRKIGSYYHLFDQWLTNMRKGKTVEAYFHKNNYKKIAIYGMKELGKQLFKELENTDIEICYVIDKDLSLVPEGIKGLRPEDVLPYVDVIVVTASYYFSDIYSFLKEKTNCSVVSIDDVIWANF